MPCPTSMRWLVLWLLLASVQATALAQSQLTVFNVDAANHPTVSARFHALDASGQPVAGLTASDFRVLEDGFDAPVTVVSCPAVSTARPASVAIGIDISNSMNLNGMGDLPINLARISAAALANALPLPPCELALQTCDQTAYINQDFTTDRNQFLSKLSAVKAIGGNNFVEHLLNDRAGLLNVAKSGKFLRAAILMTDAYWDRMAPSEVQRCIDTCKAHNIRFYAIIFGSVGVQQNGITSSLRQIAEATNGRLIDGVISRQQAEQLSLELMGELQGIEPCRIEWRGQPGCKAGRTAIVELPAYGLRDTVRYDVSNFDPSSVIMLGISPSSIALGPVNPGQTRDTVVTLTALKGAITVRSITSDNPQVMTRANGAPPAFTLQQGESRSVTIRYAAVDSAMTFARIAIESNACVGEAFYVTAGFYRNSPRQLKLNAPNGGEVFSVGDTAELTWTGVLPSEPVRLEYSIDAGATWQTIADNATGLRYAWAVPNTPSNRCLARAVERNGDGTIMVLNNDRGGDLSQVTWSPNGRMVAAANTADWTGSIRIWDAYSGAVLNTVGPHLYATCLAFSPDGSTLATGGDNGVIRLWDVATGTLIRQLGGANFRLHSLRFSPDGSMLLSAGRTLATIKDDHSVVLWDVATGLEVRSLIPSSNGFEFYSAEFSADGRHVITGGSNGQLTIYETTSQVSIGVKNHGGAVFAVRYSPDGTRMASAGANGVNIWTDGSNTPVMSIQTLRWFDDMEYLPDGNGMIVASGAVADLLELFTGTIARGFHGHTGGITSVRVSPDGRRLATSSHDGTVRIWDLEDRPLQSDESDSLWAIVTSQVVSQDIDFGTVVLGEHKDSTISAFIRNTASVVAHVENIRIFGPDGVSFSVVAGNAPFDILPGDSAAVELRFKPIGLGQKLGTIEIRTQNQTLQQLLTGAAVEPELQLAATLVDFGKVGVGDRKDSTVDIVLSNIASHPVSITSTSQNGPDDEQFAIASGGGAFVLQAGESRSMTLRFAPARIGRTSGGIKFVHNGAGGLAVAHLFGEGVAGSAPAINAVAALDAPPVACQTIESTIQLDVENIGGSTLDIDSITISGPDAASFALNPPFSGATVLPGEKTTLAIVFTPTHWGLHTATAMIASNASNGSTWSIALRGRKDTVAIASAIQTIDLGVVCPDVRIDTTVTITNTGSMMADVRGSVIGSFSLPLTQWRVDSGAIVAIPVRFSGQHDDGEYTGTYTFVDTTCGTSATIAARVRVESATVVADAMAIRGEIGSSVDTTIELRNPSNRDVAVTSGVVGNGQFEIEQANLPITIPAGASRQLTVRYRPTSGSVMTTLEMSGEPCNVRLSIPLSGSADDAPGIATVVLPEVSASAGEVVDVPVVLRNKSGRIGSDGATIQATLRFNATLLAPVESTTLGRIVGNDRLLELSLPMTPIHDSTLAVIRLQALLGNDTITSLQLDSARVSEGVGTIDAVAGQFTLTGICRSGEPRLYNPEGQTVLRVIAPNPIRSEGTIEYEVIEAGRVRLYIVDMLGRIVADLVDEVATPGASAATIDARELSSGVYRCILLTPSYTVSRPLIVDK